MPKSRTYRIEHRYEQALRSDPCVYCGAPARDLDHIVAVVKGGGDTWENLTASCGHCNKEKHDESLLIFLWKRTLPGAPAPSSPRAGVHWRRDVKRWAAYVDCVRRYQLGHFDTPEAATAAVEAWWRTNPDAMSPRARLKLRREEAVRQLWAEGLTLREIGDALGMSRAAIISFVRRMREGTGLPYVGQGGPGKRRRSRKGEKNEKKGYSYSDQSPSRPWFVQVQSGATRLRARFPTEEQAQSAVADFRRRHPGKRREQDGGSS